MSETIKTVRDLVKWAEKNDAMDMDIALQYQDSGGAYYGNTHDDNREIYVTKEDGYIRLE